MCTCSNTCLDTLCSCTCFRFIRSLGWRRQILTDKGNSITSQVRTPTRYALIGESNAILLEIK